MIIKPSFIDGCNCSAGINDRCRELVIITALSIGGKIRIITIVNNNILPDKNYSNSNLLDGRLAVL